MLVLILFFNLFFNNLVFIQCGYPPIGDEVQAGSVLLPATRRGRYLANIVRRQAVDGTGIKFNKDADRMNAEAKKKVDVLSEELLPYIIAEQERRTTLYKRVMTAIQNGEKGVTIAEIRNKPPLIIRKGLMYRCPANRAPKEPDGSGVILCEDDQDPTPIMYDSCLSAEDKELYVAENKYFFCNRHKIEGPDLPRNGSTVIGCAPLERTSLNYTSGKCALEDTDDVVVHYRYYPDRTYKFVTELDPDREVCDHWNPCQIGYIYSLPSPDQAVPANELWHDYEERPEEYEKIVPPVPEDDNKEFIANGTNYTTSFRDIPLPDGCKFLGIGKVLAGGERMRITKGDRNVLSNMTHIKVRITEPKDKGNLVGLSISFHPFMESDSGPYYVVCQEQGSRLKFIDKVLQLHEATAQLRSVTLEIVPGQKVNKTRIPLRCSKCTLKSLMLRGDDGTISNVDSTKYRLKTFGEGQKYIEFDLDELWPEDFGDIFVILQFEDGTEERNKILSVKSPESSVVKASGLVDSLQPGAHYDKTIKYDCEECVVEDILCNGESVLSGGRITVTPQSKSINLNFPSFLDEYACVYIAVFKVEDQKYKKLLAIIENASPVVKFPQVDKEEPQDGSIYVKEIPFTCDGDCSVEKVSVNGIALQSQPPSTRRNSNSGAPHGYINVQGNTIIITIPNFNFLYNGVFQAVILTSSGRVTKNILYLGDVDVNGAGGSDAPSGTAADEGDTATTAADAAPTAAEGDATSAAASSGDATTAADGAVSETTKGDDEKPEGGRRAFNAKHKY